MDKRGRAFKAGVRPKMTFYQINGQQCFPSWDAWDSDGDGKVDLDENGKEMAPRALLSPEDMLKYLRQSDGEGQVS